MNHREFSNEIRSILKTEYNYEKYKLGWNNLKKKFLKENNIPHLIILFDVLSNNFKNKNIFILLNFNAFSFK